MQKIFYVLCLGLLFSCKSKSPAKLPENVLVTVQLDKVDVLKKGRAFEIGKRLLESCNTSRFKAFSSAEATDKVRLNASQEKISATCKKINQRNGKFLGLNLINVSRNKKTNDYFFNYSIDYEKKLFKRELNVTINSENKVSAITTKEIAAKPF